MQRVAIVGGGASGFAAAVTIARAGGFSVTIYERLQKPLKKLLATGNGRCNLTNMQANTAHYCGDARFAEAVLSRFPPQSTRSFFRSMGLCTKEEDAGRVYPLSGQASSVRDVLLEEARRLSVQIVTDCEITEVRAQEKGFLLNQTYFCDILVLSAGGSAAPQHGTDGGAFRLCKQLGIPVVPPVPALTALVCKRFPKNLKGVRCDCIVTLCTREKTLAECEGEVQFTEYGLSGIPIFSLSRRVSESTQPVFVRVNCVPALSASALLDFLHTAVRKTPEKSSGVLAEGLLPRALGDYLLLQSGIRKDSPVGALPEARLRSFAGIVQAFTVEVERPRGFDFAQVTAGGADCRAFSPQTMRANDYENLYACGEALNVDGDCGGYNLQWAWSSGRAAGEAIIKRQKEQRRKACAADSGVEDPA